MRSSGRVAVVVFAVVCFVFLPMCDEVQECEECVCEECPECVCEECLECVCEECLECPECVCPECPECPEFFENHFPAEYVFVSMVKEDAEGNYVELPQSNGECVFAPTGNVSMENGINGYRYFYLHFLLTLTCFNNPSETIEEFYLLGEYSFDNDYLFMTGSDYGEFMWFRYEFNGEFLELLPQWEEEDGSRTVSIILERVGEPGECASSSLGRCYRDEDCTRNFASGCYQKSACFELGGKSWRRRNSDGTYGPCETS